MRKVNFKIISDRNGLKFQSLTPQDIGGLASLKLVIVCLALLINFGCAAMPFDSVRSFSLNDGAIALIRSAEVCYTSEIDQHEKLICEFPADFKSLDFNSLEQ